MHCTLCGGAQLPGQPWTGYAGITDSKSPIEGFNLCAACTCELVTAELKVYPEKGRAVWAWIKELRGARDANHS